MRGGVAVGVVDWNNCPEGTPLLFLCVGFSSSLCKSFWFVTLYRYICPMKTTNYIMRNGKTMFLKTSGKGNKKKARLISQHQCQQCKCDFLSNKTTAKYCSDNCRQKAFQVRKRYSVLWNSPIWGQYNDVTYNDVKIFTIFLAYSEILRNFVSM